MKGTSSVPLIMGIIGSVLCIPGMLCFACVGAVVTATSEVAGAGAGVGTMVVVFGILPIVTGIVGGAYGKSNPTMSMILLIVSAVLAGIVWFMTSFTSLFHLAALILFIIGAIIAKTQKMEGAESGTYIE